MVAERALHLDDNSCAPLQPNSDLDQVATGDVPDPLFFLFSFLSLPSEPQRNDRKKWQINHVFSVCSAVPSPSRCNLSRRFALFPPPFLFVLPLDDQSLDV